ncbi:MAG: ester cyclase [SAR202 cluster bacterium]|nr:ester cyclase [SAR202 cluster bacterium]
MDKGDIPGPTALFSDDIQWTFTGMRALDKDALGGLAQGFYTAFPDMQHAVDAQTSEGDQVVTPVTFLGTHQGELMGIPASNKSVEIRGINIHKIVGGKMVEAGTVLDMMGLMQQIGAIPSQ